ncbi:bifunctional diaminohydroxyphosphoribosylaminopyrimidine deaminase/5-amino-6-(5-phosphoribosylamino)uracil reductase RibD [Chitinilyticum piscinae]|uniref:Riboflavin biosynthesis protein RibD n=1 Tax=Chitinilyticum piscinae TaxID=2866724 RepID=A0A8J7K139_9NEIS|nr:bifunctional diaminohydroxyphosphoribosylaminopyrimidine deaminase/5-amino-6-(5-phosphoribosylamino)uracil reductase RibD [Chitinilyticum piscinae]MBE9608666.1 bifunctional diaminohydroxyphosphoribosylaminopyrimidine deaminase/5-amino-6-(5-phosphoribosylamino)uracil reductase RibD [Chitinilyticum piscinae]
MPVNAAEFTAQDHGYMQRAIDIAALGLYTTTPNPRVGCVIVRDGHVVGEGWHARAGEPHAEVHALRQAGELARGATAYVTLEPCSHHGRTPPCADALLAAGVARVIAAMRDPNPLVAGRGLARLAAAGVAVASGLLQAQALAQNAGFISRMVRQRPWLRLKTACSLDGRTALANGESKWITGAAARADVQRWRARSCAMLTGIGTVLADDPQLTVRDFPVERQPLRVVLDRELRTPPSAKLLAMPGVLLFTAAQDATRQAALRERGAEIVMLPVAGNRLPLAMVLAALAQRGCNEVMLEAGATLAGSALRAGLVDELLLYQAPVLLGDPGRGVASLELASMQDKLVPRVIERRMLGDDLRTHMLFTPYEHLLASAKEAA